ncbi:polysaccharide deacetylase family protein [uncultured Clostridium sp.]|uniref:polysaccharide deacetylase family protein n=1 Tax=uncultured Clostridium sp. TaxID=59620 RepID=UPI002609ABFB|nr:polysaccharide deacetylase family protein [uncultured Clostridium sp.]
MHRYKRKRKKGNIRLVIAILIVVVIIVGGVVYFASKNKTVQAKENSSTVSKTTEQSINSSNNKEDSSKNTNTDVAKNKFGYPENGDNIIASAKSYAVPANQVFDMIETKNKVNNEKEVFLTFDDGPSENTPQILNILNKYGVHATFFAMGNNLNSEANRGYLKEAYNDGNAIGNHTYSHNFKKLYPGNNVNVDVFMKEIAQTDDMMRNILGSNFNTRVIRMPGGYMSRAYYHDKNLNALNEAFKETGIVSIDWDAETGDATGNNLPVNKLVSTAIKESTNENHVILLMHDAAAKKTTVEALPQVIQWYKDHGYSFKVIENSPMQ